MIDFGTLLYLLTKKKDEYDEYLKKAKDDNKIISELAVILRSVYGDEDDKTHEFIARRFIDEYRKLDLELEEKNKIIENNNIKIDEFVDASMISKYVRDGDLKRISELEEALKKEIEKKSLKTKIKKLLNKIWRKNDKENKRT